MLQVNISLSKEYYSKKIKIYIDFYKNFRTSLEFCKLLLSLEPDEDPLAVILSIDFYALKAKEYEWFIKFYNLWGDVRNLNQLPNIAFSLALAHFRLGNKTEADTLLQNALIMFPGVLMILLEKCSIQTDTKVLQILQKIFLDIFPKDQSFQNIISSTRSIDYLCLTFTF